MLIRGMVAACLAVCVSHTVQADVLCEVYKAPPRVRLFDFPDFASLTPKLRVTARQVAFTEADLFALEPLREDFAVRLTGGLRVRDPGVYTFYLTSDDGSQLLLEGLEVLDNGGAHYEREVRNTVSLGVGVYSFEVQYFQRDRGASLVLEWAGPNDGAREVIPAESFVAAPLPTEGLLAHVAIPGHGLMDFPDFSRPHPAAVSLTPRIGFASLPEFAGLAPGQRLSAHFGVRFTGHVRVRVAGEHAFYLRSDDGSELLVDGVRVVDNGGAHYPRERSGSARLRVGWHALEVQYFQRDLGASLSLEWAAPGGRREQLPAGDVWVRPVDGDGGETPAPRTPRPGPPTRAPATRTPATRPPTRTPATRPPTRTPDTEPPTPSPTPVPPTPAPPAGPAGKPHVEYFKAPAGVSFFDVPEFDILTPVGGRDLDGGLAYTEAELLSLEQADGTPLGDTDFALRIRGSVRASRSGRYTFFLSSDDGSHLFIDGRQAINNNGVHGEVEKTAAVTLTAGWHAIEVHYAQRNYGAALSVEWVQPGGAREVIPAESLGASAVTATAQAQQFAAEGRVWGTKQFGLVPVHMAVVPDGRVFAFGSSFGSTNQVGGDVTLWHPKTNTFQFYHDLFVFNTFCSAVIYNSYEDNIAVVGGNTKILDSDRAVSFFDYGTDTVVGSVPLRYPRWYATLVLLHDGRIVALGGITGTPPGDFVMSDEDTSEIPEIYNPRTRTWETLDGAGNHEAFGLTRRAWWYPRGYAAPPLRASDDTKVFGVSGERLWVLDVAGAGHVTLMRQTLGWFAGASCGSVMYTPGKILVMGGGQETNSDYATASRRAAIVEYDSASGTVSAHDAAPMAFGRNWVTAVVVPNGEVVALGGTRQHTSYATGVWVPDIEVWTPPTRSSSGGEWRTVAKLNKPRLYHSAAVLLPDARILVGGSGNPPFGNTPGSFGGVYGGEVPAEPVPYTDVEIYTPWYLYGSDGGFADRPVVTYTGPQPGYGADIEVTLQDPSHVISSVSCITLPAVTHSHNTAQTFTTLAYTQGRGRLTITIPKDRTHLPPGAYYIFVVNDRGVPSEALAIDGGVVLTLTQEP